MKLYQGTNIEHDFQDDVNITIDSMYGDAQYFTDCMDSAIRYATQMVEDEGGIPIVYEAYVDLGESFCVNSYYTTDRLVQLLDGINLRDFAMGIGILNSFSDEYATIASLKTGRLKLTGKQVFAGLVQHFRKISNDPMTAALDHILSIGYGSLKYTPNRTNMKPHIIYLVAEPERISVIGKKMVKHVNVYDGSAYDSRLAADDDYTSEGENKMLMQYLRNILESAEQIMNDIEMGIQVPSWSKKKIILAEDYLDVVRDYMNSKAEQ